MTMSHAADRTTANAGATESETATATTTGTGRTDRWLVGGLVVLAAGLAFNAVIGPLVADLIDYPFSESIGYQTLGLEAVTLAVVVPWALVAAVLVHRGHRAGPLAAIPPSGYAAYMFLQYVIGPQYLTYEPVILFHLGIFVCASAVLVRAWARIDGDALPEMSRRRARYVGFAVLFFAAFTTSQYLGAFGQFIAAGPVPDWVVTDTTMYWSIVFLDLGVVVPVAVATGVGVLRGRAWATQAAYGVVGWFVLVPISVSAMGIVMVLNDDPSTSVGQIAVLSVAALAFTLVAAWVYRPLFGSE